MWSIFNWFCALCDINDNFNKCDSCLMQLINIFHNLVGCLINVRLVRWYPRCLDSRIELFWYIRYCSMSYYFIFNICKHWWCNIIHIRWLKWITISHYSHGLVWIHHHSVWSIINRPCSLCHIGHTHAPNIGDILQLTHFIWYLVRNLFIRSPLRI